ncbi:MAG: dephospho-CoA kinase [Chlorobi bacterium]|nr:dephospho-CoA kinase [Chlorobiota bacterium]
MICRVAVTGGFGSGKSTVCAFLEKEGYPVISTDRVARELLHGDESIRQQVIQTFGETILGEDGDIDRSKLAARVFADPNDLERLEDILHPPTLKAVDDMINDLPGHHSIVFIESALIFETGIEELFDFIIVVVADTDQILKRYGGDARITRDEILRRIASQMPAAEKASRADFVIRNNGTLKQLRENTLLILTIITAMCER